MQIKKERIVMNKHDFYINGDWVKSESPDNLMLSILLQKRALLKLALETNKMLTKPLKQHANHLNCIHRPQWTID